MDSNSRDFYLSLIYCAQVKMHVILNKEELSHIICWMPHGRSWRLVDPVEFESVVIPKYFGHASLQSFMRQANGWGFKRELVLCSSIVLPE